jgi:hypothetical protein
MSGFHLLFCTSRYEWMYAQPFINWTQTEADDPDSLRFQLDPNNREVRTPQALPPQALDQGIFAWQDCQPGTLPASSRAHRLGRSFSQLLSFAPYFDRTALPACCTACPWPCLTLAPCKGEGHDLGSTCASLPVLCEPCSLQTPWGTTCTVVARAAAHRAAQDYSWQDRMRCGNYSTIGGDKRTVTIITNLGYAKIAHAPV